MGSSKLVVKNISFQVNIFDKKPEIKRAYLPTA
jgi:hypothetical protein